MPTRAASKTNEMVRQQFGGRIQHAREAVDIPRDALAKRVGVTLATVKAWEAGKRQPRANQITTIAGVLNVTTPWLLEGRETEYMDETSETSEIPAMRAKLAQAKVKMRELSRLIKDLDEQLATLEDNS